MLQVCTRSISVTCDLPPKRHHFQRENLVKCLAIDVAKRLTSDDVLERF